MRFVIPVIFSLLMFSLIFYAIAAFATWEWHPAMWREWLRAVVAIGIFACWIWDTRR